MLTLNRANIGEILQKQRKTLIPINTKKPNGGKEGKPSKIDKCHKSQPIVDFQIIKFKLLRQETRKREENREMGRPEGRSDRRLEWSVWSMECFD